MTHMRKMKRDKPMKLACIQDCEILKVSGAFVEDSY